MSKKKVALIVGTRPEVIKMAPLVFALKASTSLEPVLLSTGQHREMLDQAMATFELTPDADLGLMEPGQTLPGLMARAITAVTDYLERDRPDAVLVQGDTTTVLAGGMAAFLADVPVGHVEAGLRTGNMRSPFPEEMNRRLTSPLARWHFCPTAGSQSNLESELIEPSACHVTGNTVVDSLLWVRYQLEKRGVSGSAVAERLGIPPAFAERYLSAKCQLPTADFVLVTGHRRESFGGGFERICEAILGLQEKHPDVGILYPVHLNPKVQEPVNRLLGECSGVALCKPAGYEDFVWLMNQAKFMLSDSGGVQEEAPSLGKPVLVMRETTERPEGVDAGTCRLVGTDPVKILEEADILLSDRDEYTRRSALQNPYGDGEAAKRIVEVLERDLGRNYQKAMEGNAHGK